MSGKGRTAFIKGDHYTNAINGGLAFLIQNKGAYGNWDSTQATILTLKTMLLALGGVGKDADISVAVLVDGKASLIKSPGVCYHLILKFSGKGCAVENVLCCNTYPSSWTGCFTR